MSSTTSYSGNSCDRPVPPVTCCVPGTAPPAARCRARLSARNALLKARDESVGLHCHGCPALAPRTVVCGRTCAALIVGINAPIAIADVTRFRGVLRILNSSEMERRRVFATHHGEPADKYGSKSANCKKLAPCVKGTDVERFSILLLRNNDAPTVKNVRCARVRGVLHLRFSSPRQRAGRRRRSTDVRRYTRQRQQRGNAHRSRSFRFDEARHDGAPAS